MKPETTARAYTPPQSHRPRPRPFHITINPSSTVRLTACIAKASFSLPWPLLVGLGSANSGADLSGRELGAGEGLLGLDLAGGDARDVGREGLVFGRRDVDVGGLGGGGD